jgi:hypothetical protein
MSDRMQKLADSVLGPKLTALEPVFALMAPSVRESVHEESASIRHFAVQLDARFDYISSACVQAQSAKEVGAILRRLRGDGLKFLSRQTFAIRSLRLALQVTHADARLRGLQGAATRLSIERNLDAVDEAVGSINPWQDRVVEGPEEMFRRARDLLLLPLRVTQDARLWSAVPKEYASAKQQLISNATRGLVRLSWTRLGQIVWVEAQQNWGTVFAWIFLIVSTLLGWLVGKAVTGAIFAVVFAVGVRLLQPLIERIFAAWHLRNYQRLCLHTAYELFQSQTIALASVIGLQQIADFDSDNVSTRTVL